MPLPSEYLPAAGSDLYYALRFLPRAARQRASVLEAARTAIAGIPLAVSDPGVARVKLQWWREELARLAGGQPRHPLAQALAALPCAGPAVPALRALVDGTELAFAPAPPADLQALHARFLQAHGPLWRLHGDAAARPAALADDPLARLGATIELGYGMLDLRALLAAQRSFLPRDACPRGTAPADLLAPAARAIADQAIAEFAGGVLAALREAQARWAASGTACPLARLRAALLERTLGEAQREGFLLLRQRTSLTPLRKLALAWRLSLSA